MARPKGYRPSDEVQSVVLRMGVPYVRKLDAVCEANDRSRRVLIEILIDEAYAELEADPQARIMPITPVRGERT